MSFKLTVTREAEPARYDEFVFSHDRVSIGRDSLCDLTLPDPQRLVSKQHALVEHSDGRFHLIDLGSKNQTVLNSRRIGAQQPTLLQNGDRIKIGDFILEFQVVESAVLAVDLDKTVFGNDFVNPFDEDARALAEALGRVVRTHATEPIGRRDDALREAFEDAMFGLERGEATRLVAEMLVPLSELGRAAPQSTPASPAPAPPYPARPYEAPPPYAPSGADAVPGDPWQREAAFGRDAGAQPEQSGPMTQVVDLLLEAVVQLVRGLWQFRLEFLGQTVIETPGTFAVHTSSAEEASRYLLDPGIPEDERNRRLMQVESAVQDVLAHQVGVLEGYKAGVKDGVTQLIDELDPSRQEEGETEKRSGLDFLFKSKEGSLERIERKHREMKAEHHGAFEKRFFRPAFIRTYLRAISAASEATPRIR